MRKVWVLTLGIMNLGCFFYSLAFNLYGLSRPGTMLMAGFNLTIGSLLVALAIYGGKP